jgi:hypothetical protein
MSPYQFSHPEGEPADMTWAKPLFCDVVVHLAKRDIDNKTSYTSADGCYLGHDFKRNCQIVYVPALRRIGHFHVRVWRRGSFECCKGITFDTPVSYREPDDLFYGKPTAALLPERFMLPRGLAATDVKTASAARIKEGVAELLASDQHQLLLEIVTERRKGLEMSETLMAANVSGPAADEGVQFELVLIGTESAKATVSNYSQIIKIGTIEEARRSPYWPQIRAGMEGEIKGKVANGFAKVVKDEGQRKMKLKWVIMVFLGLCGVVLKVKCRLVACGYSQLPSEYGKTYAPTLPGPCYRLFCTIVAQEDLETDFIDAVKAFTQAKLDRVLYSEMPLGFRTPGYILMILMALEGLKQGSALWFEKNKWALNKCNMTADLAEPNLYTHTDLSFLVAVFADDVGAGFDLKERPEYLALRKDYGKLIKIDSPGPDLTVPISQWIGTEWERDRREHTLKVTQVKYIEKLEKKYEGRYTLNDMPYPADDKGRKAFEELPLLKEGKEVDRGEYLSLMGDIGWPTVMTRAEVAHAFSVLSSCSMEPREAHLDAGLYVIGYFVNTKKLPWTAGGKLKIPMGLTSYPRNFEQSCGVWGSTDSSWGKQPRPYGGHVIFRCNVWVIASSKTLKLVPDSTAEAETAEGSRAVKSGTYFKAIVAGIKRKIMGPLPITADNKAMTQIVEKEGTSHRTRHFERATMLIKWAVLKLLVVLHLVRSAECVADIFTKAVTKDVFMRMRAVLLNLPHRDAALDAAARLASALSRLPSRLFGV